MRIAPVNRAKSERRMIRPPDASGANVYATWTALRSTSARDAAPSIAGILGAARGRNRSGSVRVAELPSGTVTFLFTDLEGSTALWEAHPDAMRGGVGPSRRAAGRRDRRPRRRTWSRPRATASSPRSPTRPTRWRAAIDAQLALAGEPWPETGPLRVRMGVHTGAAELRDGDYHGPTLNRAARLMSVGHGGQILVSLVTSELVRGSGVDARGPRVAPAPRPGRARARLPGGASRAGVRVRRAAVPATPTRRDPPCNLPAPLDRFVGRVHELRAGRGAPRPRTRLLTLVRPRRHRQDPAGGAGGERPPRRLRRPGVLRRPERVSRRRVGPVGHRPHDRGARAERPAAARCDQGADRVADDAPRPRQLRAGDRGRDSRSRSCCATAPSSSCSSPAAKRCT